MLEGRVTQEALVHNLVVVSYGSTSCIILKALKKSFSNSDIFERIENYTESPLALTVPARVEMTVIGGTSTVCHFH
jgi:hypothetical protein